MGEKIGFFVNTDYCNGCQTCQVGCREINRVPFEEQWLSVTRNHPKLVDGELRLQFSYLPELDKCANCLTEDEEPYCQAVCTGHCLRVGLCSDIEPEIARSKDRWFSITTYISNTEGDDNDR